MNERERERESCYDIAFVRSMAKQEIRKTLVYLFSIPFPHWISRTTDKATKKTKTWAQKKRERVVSWNASRTDRLKKKFISKQHSFQEQETRRLRGVEVKERESDGSIVYFAKCYKITCYQTVCVCVNECEVRLWLSLCDRRCLLWWLWRLSLGLYFPDRLAM